MAKAASTPPLDQNKVSNEAQNLAGGQQPPDPNAENAPPQTGDPGNVPPPDPGNTPPAQPAVQSEQKTAAAPQISTGNPNAFKPGEKPETTPAPKRSKANLEKEYGPDYVVARKATAGESGKFTETVFSRTAWDLLGTNKEGWKQSVETPPEAKNL